MKINICGLDYEVVDSDKLLSDEKLWGEINHVSQKITLDTNVRHDRYMQTLYHEVVHGILHGLGYHELHDDEIFVTSFANMMYQAIGGLNSNKNNLCPNCGAKLETNGDLVFCNHEDCNYERLL